MWWQTILSQVNREKKDKSIIFGMYDIWQKIDFEQVGIDFN